jgi:integrase/recombinase XerD
MTPEQEKAKDFWFLSFYTQGMNINDILKLKNENITYIDGKQYIQYVRAKTRSTGSKSPKEKKSQYILKLGELSKNIQTN